MIGISGPSTTIKQLFISQPTKAAKRCSIVFTSLSPLAMVVHLSVCVTKFTSAGIFSSGSISLRTKLKPLFSSAGFNVRLISEPVCNPIPFNFISFFIVFCFLFF